jgi:nucleotide-binding universal stress UspA family protein
MSEQTIASLEPRDRERHLLVAVDGSENSKRAVMYVADFFGSDRDVVVTVLSLIPEPSEDYFSTDGERDAWITEKKTEMQKILDGYKEILTDAGIAGDKVRILLVVRQCESIGDAILEEQNRLRTDIVVVGRRGLSHNEEFIFGSTSNRILHHAKNCAVMVVE